jgi:GNAT superfamily N-acetyltransferase
MDEAGALWIARDQGGEPVGYAFATLAVGPDDTFESSGTAELVSLIVDESVRRSGIGLALIQAVERAARSLGIDLFKVAVMAGNDTAFRFYQLNGFELAEQVLYRPIA